MSDTPRTESQLLTVKDCSYVAPHPTGEYVHADFARQLERENAALKEELAPLRETVGVRGDAVTSRDDIAYWCKLMDRAGKADRLERENAVLREAFAKADVMYEYGRDDGQRRWVTFSMWIRKGQIVVLMDTAALIAARKEDKP